MSETIPKGWTNTTYSEVLSRRKETHTNNGTYPLYSLTIEKGVTPKSDRYEREFLVRDKEAKKYAVIYPNDLVFNPSNLRWGAIARSKVSFKVLASPIYEICEPNIRKITPEYLGYLATSDLMMRRYLQFVQGTLVERTGLHIDDFLPIPISIPLLTEQQKIAEILTFVDKVIENTQSQINKLEDLKKATMNELLTKGIGHTEFKETEIGRIPKSWGVASLEELGTLKNGLNKGKNDFGHGVKFVNISDAYGETLDLTQLGRLNASEKELMEYSLIEGDLVFVRSSVKLSGVAIPTDFEYCSEPVVFCGFMIRFRPFRREISTSFLRQYFLLQKVRIRIEQLATGGANININQESLGSFKVPVPPIEDANPIVLTNKKFQLRINAEKAKLNKFHQLKRSLMQDLLTGKVRVTVN